MKTFISWPARSLGLTSLFIASLEAEIEQPKDATSNKRRKLKC